MNAQYGFFYPENNQRYLAGLSFDSAAEAIEWWRDRRTHWQQLTITPVFAGGSDVAAFLNPTSGEIVVVREIAP